MDFALINEPLISLRQLPRPHRDCCLNQAPSTLHFLWLELGLVHRCWIVVVAWFWFCDCCCVCLWNDLAAIKDFASWRAKRIGHSLEFHALSFLWRHIQQITAAKSVLASLSSVSSSLKIILVHRQLARSRTESIPRDQLLPKPIGPLTTKKIRVIHSQEHHCTSDIFEGIAHLATYTKWASIPEQYAKPKSWFFWEFWETNIAFQFPWTRRWEVSIFHYKIIRGLYREHSIPTQVLVYRGFW